MKWNRSNLIIGASLLALLALIAFQVKWMTDSRNLIEEQFNQKVSMAMCYAVDMLGPDHASISKAISSCTANPNGCNAINNITDGFEVETSETIDVPVIKEALGMALSFYNVKMDYEVEISEKQQFTSGMLPKYSCSLNPTEKNDNHLLIVSFPGKQNYIFGKMKFMLFSSILILFVISTIFVLASYTILRQKRMHQMNKEFFNNMAHEFKTPLTNISLAGSLLLKNKNESKKEKYLKVVKEESSKLANQVERILQLAKLENGEYQLEKENLCIRNLIEDVIQEMDLQIKEKKARINFEIKTETTLMEGDKFHLRNAFRNLLENALKYSSESPEIDIQLESDQEGVKINFQDNGIGIAKKDQKDVFEKYHRVQKGNVHDQKGFGLGLAYVKMIVERHKGVIKIFSDLNKGTRFDLFLPAQNKKTSVV